MKKFDRKDSMLLGEKLYPNATIRMEILKSFGADLDGDTRENIIFVNKALIYPCGRHLALRDLFLRGDNDMHKNDQIFILMEDDVKNINCLNASQDGYLLLVATESINKCEINIYNLTKINFNNFTQFKPRRKIMSESYLRFVYASFSEDGNTLGVIAVNKDNSLIGLIYDIQVLKKFKMENYVPKYTFNIPKGANKISFLSNKIFCVTGKNYLSFWICYESMCKEIKSNINYNKNYVDHCWIKDAKVPLLATITDSNDLYIYIGIYEKPQIMTNKKNKNKNDNKNDDKDQTIEKFSIKQSINNIFNLNNINNLQNINDLFCTCINTYSDGLVIGSNKGNILFIEKLQNNEYVPVRYTIREREGAVTGLCFDMFNNMTLAISFKTNEIAYIDLQNIISNLKNPEFDLKFNVICEGFHNGPITCMDVALQRPIIITCSKSDKTIRIWNYLTGHCEYCKIILEERDNNEEKEINILSVAIHPNGYYLAISDLEMIRFFHLCYKELRFYNNDQVGNEQNKSNCTILKFSNGGHLLGAASDKKVFIIKSLTRETLKSYTLQKNVVITSIFFHNDDTYFYTCDNNGNITQYNLLDFTISKFVNNGERYNSTIICRNPVKMNKYQQRVEQRDNIVSIGENINTNQYILSNIRFEPSKINTKSTKYTSSYIEENGISCCHINTKRYEIQSLIVGTEKGKIYLYNNNIKNNVNLEKYDVLYCHSKKVNFLYFVRELNLLFSAGEDGNIFIYCIYEYPDNDVLNSDENNKITINNQLNTILDEGLGDNVLMNIFEINTSEKKIDSKKEEIYKLQKIVDENNKSFNKKFKDKVNELNKLRDTEINKLKQKIDEMILSKNTMIEDYEKKIDEINKEQYNKYVEREVIINEKFADLNKQIVELKDFNELMKKDFEKIVKDNNYSKLRKFRELEFHLQNHVHDLDSKNKSLEEEIKNNKDIEEKKLKIIENEHQYEVQKKIDTCNDIIKRNNEELEFKIKKIKILNEKISELEYLLNKNENKLKNFIEENERLSDTLSKLKKQLENREIEKTNITEKLNELKGNFNEKLKLENFLKNLKSNLYKKNFLLSKKYNTEVLMKEELKDSSKVLEKQLEDTINLLVNREKEINKQKILIEELKKKLEYQNRHTKSVKKDFNNLLKRIFDSYQTCDSKEILNSVREIYHKYLSNDAKKNFDSNKLNVNLRSELEKQIDYLQRELTNKNEGIIRKERMLNSDYAKKMQENAILLEEMTRVKKLHAEMTNEIKELKEKNLNLTQTIEKFKGKNSYNNIYNSNIISNNNNSNSKIQNNSSEQSNGLPVIKRGIDHNQKGLNYIKNKMFKKDYKLTLDDEKNIKYNEMRRIIEGKDNLIQRLTTENDILRLNYLNSPKACKTPHNPKIKINY